jgi:hypothetical protein
MNLEPDQGGEMPGFDAGGMLAESSGPNTCQYGDCVSYTITMKGEIG